MPKWDPDAFAPNIFLVSGLLCFVWSLSVIISIYIQICFLSTLTSVAMSPTLSHGPEARRLVVVNVFFLFSAGMVRIKVEGK